VHLRLLSINFADLWIEGNLKPYFFYFRTIIHNRGALKLRAENKPFEPDPDNAGAGKRASIVYFP